MAPSAAWHTTTHRLHQGGRGGRRKPSAADQRQRSSGRRWLGELGGATAGCNGATSRARWVAGRLQPGPAVGTRSRARRGRPGSLQVVNLLQTAPCAPPWAAAARATGWESHALPCAPAGAAHSAAAGCGLARQGGLHRGGSLCRLPQRKAGNQGAGEPHPARSPPGSACCACLAACRSTSLLPTRSKAEQ